MKFIVKSLEGEPHFYDCGNSFADVNSLRNKAWQQNNKKVEIRVYDDTVEHMLHSEIITTIA